MSYFIPPASVKKSSCTVLNHQNCSRYLLVNRKASTVQINKIIKLSRKFIETKGEFTNPPTPPAGVLSTAFYQDNTY